MTKKQFRARLRLLIVLTLLLLGMIGFASAKYVQTISFQGSVTFTASLAENVILQEHKSVANSDGSYKLGEAVVKNNTYTLLPGLDIPKDPHIIIEGKTPIPAYLFVEVVDQIGNDAVKWQIDTANWVELKNSESQNVVGNNGGKVYVYKTPLTDTNVPTSINVLNEQKITVGQHLNCDGRTITGGLSFYVKLIEKVGNADAIKAYGGYKTTND